MSAPSGSRPPVLALIPAAGRAARLGALPCSKEIFPVGFRTGEDGRRRARPVCEHLLEGLRDAGIRRGYVLLRQGKWDIPALLGRGLAPDTEDAFHLAYLALEPTASVPETLDRAHPFAAGQRIALGFPDILFEPRDAFRALLEHLDATSVDIVLGLFPTDRVEKTDMVELGADGNVRRIRIKDPTSPPGFTWSIAAWEPAFTDYLHTFLAERRATPGGTELSVGHVIEAAMADGLEVAAVRFSDGSYLDVGTPEDLERAVVTAVDSS